MIKEFILESESIVLNVRNLSKRFDMTQALEDVSMDMKVGEIHALVGENGAGKSTLIKILTGIQHADQGEVLLQGQPVRISDAQEAQSL
ncbi:MAG: ATP-binding cassette domain-containing protein, partial [SAR324 cluster bacterium]|nr:ATP-binding cassette domain-containing protein [SAR324 cluster bacterium]